MRSFALLAVTLLMSVSAFATPGTCFYGRSIDSFRVTGPDTIEVRDGFTYTVKLAFCSSLRWTERIAFDSFSGSWVCENDNVLTLDWNNRVMDRCLITDITRQ